MWNNPEYCVSNCWYNRFINDAFCAWFPNMHYLIVSMENCFPLCIISYKCIKLHQYNCEQNKGTSELLYKFSCCVPDVPSHTFSHPWQWVAFDRFLHYLNPKNAFMCSVIIVLKTRNKNVKFAEMRVWHWGDHLTLSYWWNSNIFKKINYSQY